MIHAYLVIVNNDTKDNHGYRFMAMLRQVSQMSGIEIPVTEKVTNLSFANDAPAKPLAVITVKRKNDPKTAYAIMNIVAFRASIEKMKERKPYPGDITIGYEITSDMWTKKARTMRVQKLSKNGPQFYYFTDEELYNDLLENGEVIFEIRG
jgi:hypothetical protein